MLVVPFLLQNQPDASASPGAGTPSQPATGSARPEASTTGHAPAAQGPVPTDAATVSAVRQVAPTTTTAPVPTTEPVETTLPAQVVVSHAVVATTTPTTVPPTTTTAPPVAAAAVAPGSGSGGTGQVTYYDHPAGTCASPFLPFGTVVEITNPANDESVSCVVNDREADTARSIDLATSTFAEIAPLSQGVIDAQLSW